MRLSTVSALLGGLVATGSALSDLDASVWKNLDSKQSSRAFRRVARNRPTKRVDGFSPPSDLKSALEEVWAHYVKTYDGGVDGNTNWGFHQVMANDGHLNICVRWDSNQTVTAAQRTKIATVYKAQYQKWFKWLYGYDGFPYSEVGVNIVGWAVTDKSLLEGSTDGLNIYTDLDSDGIPMCNVGCSRDAHLDGDYSACAAGSDAHYDQSLWLTEGLDGGYGYSWGQQVGREYFMNNIDSDNIHILLHEMGHTFGLDDFYDWTPTGQSAFIMLAGAAMEVTDFDGWMYRNWWYYLANKNNWGSSSSSSGTASSVTPTATSAAATSAAAATETAAAESVVESAVETSAVETSAVPTSVTVEKQEQFDEATPTPSGWGPSRPTWTPSRPSRTPVHTPGFATPTPSAGSGEAAPHWAQCGGANWTGTTRCAANLKCVQHNDFYSQCL